MFWMRNYNKMDFSLHILILISRQQSGAMSLSIWAHQVDKTISVAPDQLVSSEAR